MSSIDEVFARLEGAVQALSALDWDGLAVGDRLSALERLETLRRQATACSYDLGAAVSRCGSEALGGPAHRVIADILRITPRDSKQRLADAAQLAPRTTLIGQPLPPVLPGTARAWHAGQLDAAHLRAIQRFHREVPEHIPAVEVERAEGFLAAKAADLRPDQLEKVADKLAVTINPDGNYSDEHRARQRGFTWCGPQRPDGMSVGKLVASPELRAMLDALLAKLAAPGMCNPADQTPTVAGEPAPETVSRDARSHPQRQHDGLAALCRNWLGDPRLGQHRGLPVTVIVSTTLEQICSAAGYATTGGGTQLPMRDLIRMASHAWHYLCVFDSHSQRPLYLGRSKRIASADQRIVLHNKDLGCTHPGCDMPGYLSEVHHINEWADGGATDIDELTFGCPPHHKLVTEGGWSTRKRKDGSTEWIPPPRTPHLRGGTNDFFHPERQLTEREPRPRDVGADGDAA